MSEGQKVIAALPRATDPLVDVTCSYEEQVIEVHTVGQMIELSVEDAEALGHKLLAIAQDCREARVGVVHQERT